MLNATLPKPRKEWEKTKTTLRTAKKNPFLPPSMLLPSPLSWAE